MENKMKNNCLSDLDPAFFNDRIRISSFHLDRVRSNSSNLSQIYQI